MPNKSEVAVLHLLRNNPNLTRNELAAEVGITDNGVKKILANLKAYGWIVRHGSNKKGYWEVAFNSED